jgi:hypothetical protein
LLAAAETFGNIPLAVAQTPQGGCKICALRHGGQLGPLGQLAALPRQFLVRPRQPVQVSVTIGIALARGSLPERMGALADRVRHRCRTEDGVRTITTGDAKTLVARVTLSSAIPSLSQNAGTLTTLSSPRV